MANPIPYALFAVGALLGVTAFTSAAPISERSCAETLELLDQTELLQFDSPYSRPFDYMVIKSSSIDAALAHLSKIGGPSDCATEMERRVREASQNGYKPYDADDPDSKLAVDFGSLLASLASHSNPRFDDILADKLLSSTDIEDIQGFDIQSKYDRPLMRAIASSGGPLSYATVEHLLGTPHHEGFGAARLLIASEAMAFMPIRALTALLEFYCSPAGLHEMQANDADAAKLSKLLRRSAVDTSRRSRLTHPVAACLKSLESISSEAGLIRSATSIKRLLQLYVDEDPLAAYLPIARKLGLLDGPNAGRQAWQKLDSVASNAQRKDRFLGDTDVSFVRAFSDLLLRLVRDDYGLEISGIDQTDLRLDQLPVDLRAQLSWGKLRAESRLAQSLRISYSDGETHIETARALIDRSIEILNLGLLAASARPVDHREQIVTAPVEDALDDMLGIESELGFDFQTQVKSRIPLPKAGQTLIRDCEAMRLRSVMREIDIELGVYLERLSFNCQDDQTRESVIWVGDFPVSLVSAISRWPRLLDAMQLSLAVRDWRKVGPAGLREIDPIDLVRVAGLSATFDLMWHQHDGSELRDIVSNWIADHYALLETPPFVRTTREANRIAASEFEGKGLPTNLPFGVVRQSGVVAKADSTYEQFLRQLAGAKATRIYADKIHTIVRNHLPEEVCEQDLRFLCGVPGAKRTFMPRVNALRKLEQLQASSNQAISSLQHWDAERIRVSSTSAESETSLNPPVVVGVYHDDSFTENPRLELKLLIAIRPQSSSEPVYVLLGDRTSGIPYGLPLWSRLKIRLDPILLIDHQVEYFGITKNSLERLLTASVFELLALGYMPPLADGFFPQTNGLSAADAIHFSGVSPAHESLLTLDLPPGLSSSLGGRFLAAEIRSVQRLAMRMGRDLVLRRPGRPSQAFAGRPPGLIADTEINKAVYEAESKAIDEINRLIDQLNDNEVYGASITLSESGDISLGLSISTPQLSLSMATDLNGTFVLGVPIGTTSLQVPIAAFKTAPASYESTPVGTLPRDRVLASASPFAGLEVVADFDSREAPSDRPAQLLVKGREGEYFVDARALLPPPTIAGKPLNERGAFNNPTTFLRILTDARPFLTDDDAVLLNREFASGNLSEAAWNLILKRRKEAIEEQNIAAGDMTRVWVVEDHVLFESTAPLTNEQTDARLMQLQADSSSAFEKRLAKVREQLAPEKALKDGIPVIALRYWHDFSIVEVIYQYQLANGEILQRSGFARVRADLRGKLRTNRHAYDNLMLLLVARHLPRNLPPPIQPGGGAGSSIIDRATESFSDELMDWARERYKKLREEFMKWDASDASPSMKPFVPSPWDAPFLNFTPPSWARVAQQREPFTRIMLDQDSGAFVRAVHAGELSFEDGKPIWYASTQR